MNRNLDRSSNAPWMLLAAILSIGAVATWFVAFGIATMIYSWFGTNRSYIDQLVFTVEGQPLLQSHNPNGAYDGNYAVYRTLDGQKIEDPDSLHLSQVAAGDELPFSTGRDIWGDAWMWRIKTQLQIRPAPVAWYLIHDAQANGLAWFVGYQPITRQRIGYLGRSGFRQDLPPPPDRFSLPKSLFNHGGVAPAMDVGTNEPTYRSEVPAEYLVSDESLVKIDLARQAVESVPMPDKVISVGTYTELTAVSDDRYATYENRLLVRLPKELHILTFEGEPLRTIPLTTPMQDAIVALMGTTTDELILIAHGEDHASPRELYWIGPGGEVTRHVQVNLYPPKEDNSRTVAWGVSTAMPVPAALLVSSILTVAMDRSGDRPQDFASAYAEFARAAWPPFLVLLCISAGLAFIAHRRQRAMNGRGGLAWAAFVVLLGPPGFVGYWTHRRWPAVARCEHCGAVVPRDRGTCLACAAEFSPPAPRGIEIFA